MAATLTHHHADLGDVILHYITAGDGFPVVLLHGMNGATSFRTSPTSTR